MRGVTRSGADKNRQVWFLLTRLMRGVTNRSVPLAPVHLFLLTRLMRGVTGFDVYSADADRFLLTRLMRGVTGGRCKLAWCSSISTHTPHARRDFDDDGRTGNYIYFYSHASCEAWHCPAKPDTAPDDFYSHASCEAWPAGWLSSPPHLVFLLTRLMRGVTPHIHAILSVPQFLLTRLMRGVTPSVQSWKVPDTISTHTPHARRDIFSWYYVNNFRISTHTPHARRDLNPPFRARLRQNFYSHASCEAWPQNIRTFHNHTTAYRRT